ncbi:MAG: ATP-binding cassette domain-containing protein [Alphaproteobacteria bacterium]|nr:ATP-binding cassette domain-containing protein [Alphaproteobacteria bacterium]
MPSLVFQNISKFYNNFKALQDLNFTLEKGKISGFLGPNGAGKSTTFKILAGIIQANSGSYKFQNHVFDISTLKSKFKIGYLAENNPLYLDMFVTEYLEFIAQANQLNHSDAIISDYIVKTALTTEKHKKIKTLSKGNKQRVGLAAALIIQPDILLLDEPTTGLDPNQIIDIRNLLKEEAQNKMIFFSSHLIAEVSHLCNQIIIIYKGSLVDNIQQINLLTEAELTAIFQSKTQTIQYAPNP